MDSYNKPLLLVFILLGLLYGTIAHSYVTSPTSRSNQKQTQTGCRGPNCLGPCDVPLSRKTRAPIQVSRGQQVNIQWPRNNHAGGFIRFAWAPTAQSDSMSVFDNNVQLITCHEVGGCGPDSASNPNGGDSGPADGSSRACQVSFNIPSHLSDGEWTLQWAWFGGAFALGDYYSCVDYKISGGSLAAFTPAFVGGDYTNPGQQKCKFFNTNKLHQCVNEPCNNPTFALSQQQSGAVAADQLKGGAIISSGSATPSPTPSSSSSSSSGRTTTTTTTTGRPASSTSTSTTGRPASNSSGASSSGSSSGSSTSIVGTACSNPGFMKCVTGGYSTCDHGVWKPVQACSPSLTCKTNGNYIMCDRP